MNIQFLYLNLIRNDVKLVHPVLRFGDEIVTAVYIKSVVWNGSHEVWWLDKFSAVFCAPEGRSMLKSYWPSGIQNELS